MKKFFPLILVAVIFMVYRILSYSGVGFPVNSAPISALFLCAVLYAGVRGAVIASVIWIVSYPFLSLLQGYEVSDGMLASVVGIVLTVWLGLALKKSTFEQKPWASVLGGSLLATLGFYFITNCFSWLGLPLYEKNLQGFYQAQWSGHPSLILPTWVFLRNSLIGNGALAFIMLLAHLEVPFFATNKDLRKVR